MRKKKVLVTEVALKGSEEKVLRSYKMYIDEAETLEWNQRQRSYVAICEQPLKAGYHYISSGRVPDKRSSFKVLKLFVVGNILTDKEFIDVAYQLNQVVAYHGGFR